MATRARPTTRYTVDLGTATGEQQDVLPFFRLTLIGFRVVYVFLQWRNAGNCTQTLAKQGIGGEACVIRRAGTNLGILN